MGTRASLRSLHFLTPMNGWVAGREELPQGGGSVGVLLYTRDGGITWVELTTTVPNVQRVLDHGPLTLATTYQYRIAAVNAEMSSSLRRETL